MEIYIKLFEVLFPVFFVVGIGYYLGRQNPKIDTTFITNFAANIGTPSMIIYAVTSTGITFDIFVNYFWYYLLAIILFSIVGIITLYILKTKDIIRELPPLILPNTGNMGLPICLFAYGSQGLGVSAAISSLIILFHFTLGVFSALFAGLAYNCIGKLKNSEDPLVIIFYFPLVTLPFITPYTIMNWVDPLPIQWLYLVGVGVCVQIAQYFMTLAYQTGKVSSLSLYNNLGPLFAVFFGLTLFKEGLLLVQFFGIFLVLLGVYLNTKAEEEN